MASDTALLPGVIGVVAIMTDNTMLNRVVFDSILFIYIEKTSGYLSQMHDMLGQRRVMACQTICHHLSLSDTGQKKRAALSPGLPSTLQLEICHRRLRS